ncbi:S-adenosyl methyltransferase [Micromonospora sp. Llam0]|uniref:SAM-dependent methyltransferase n=1 Tax=Micromonospora sp. Llam0 TaxID=2485143 RepID=UPI000F49D98B|nr:SAM-dependent methyltransferase [Micromonospora sp. Llam0]ROO60407.1 S-adenosyl methyltransferase [Micromonospora sp. Llam0]
MTVLLHTPPVPTESPTYRGTPTVLDTNRPALARLVNYWAGGKDHFATDRHLGDQITQAHPDLPSSYQAARQAAARAVTALAASGVRQFVDLCPGLPDPDGTDTHLIAQHTAPTSTVVYVDPDPLVLAHCRALHISHTAGTVTIIDADPTQPANLATAVTNHLDLTAPVAVLATSLVHHLDDHLLHNLVTQLARRLPDGSRIVVTTHTIRRGDDRLRQVQHRFTRAGIPYHPRTPAQIADLLHRCGLTPSPHAGTPPTAPTRPALDDGRSPCVDVQTGQINSHTPTRHPRHR